MSGIRHVRARWPEPVVPQGEPEWLLYELDEQADAVTRSVYLFSDGSVTRNSIAIEQRYGDPWPSLIDTSLAEGFSGVEFDELSASEFENAWSRGVDTPFWNVR
jgi:hypothetical protein